MEEMCLFADNPEYEAFVDKFKPKLTTDDCYTPPLVYETVANWACKKYAIDPAKLVRPFYPGGDYVNFPYPEGAVVLDNPPFSILTEICGFYLDRKIPFFLFAPSLTVFSGKATCMRMNHIVCDADVVYENGAVVKTAFVTSFGGDVVAETAPDLAKELREVSETLKKTKTIPKYTYPDYVLTATMMQKMAKYGVYYSVKRSECIGIKALDAQKAKGKSLFGGGFLLSEKAAAEKAAAEKAAAEKAAAEKTEAIVWEISDREREIIRRLEEEV